MRISKTLKEVLLAVSACAALFVAPPVALSQTLPSITTNNSPPTVNLTGQTSVTLSDQATLSGFPNPTGTMQFTLTGPGATAVFTVPVNGNAIYGPVNFVLPQNGPVAGTYSWVATFSGVSSTNPETTMVSAANPSLTTTTSTVGSSLTDSALLQGGYFPTGNIVFALVLPDLTTVTIGTDPVNGNGTYTAPGVFTPVVPGTYTWNVMYVPLGDMNNNGVSAMAEPVTVGSSVPEPGTWALMLLGFAGLGFFAHRRRRQSKLA
jgi:hypothetical protein